MFIQEGIHMDYINKYYMSYWMKRETNFIETVNASITDVYSECLVNVINSNMTYGGAICTAVFSAAGYDNIYAACKKIGHCDVGSVVLTDGYRLSQKHIIHTVTPKWDPSKQESSEHLLRKCYENAMIAAKNLGYHSITIPVLGIGHHGFPIEVSLRIGMQTIVGFFHADPKYYMHVIFTVIDEDVYIKTQKAILQYASEFKLDLRESIDWHEYVRVAQWLITMIDPNDKDAIQKGKRILKDIFEISESSEKLVSDGQRIRMDILSNSFEKCFTSQYWYSFKRHPSNEKITIESQSLIKHIITKAGGLSNIY